MKIFWIMLWLLAAGSVYGPVFIYALSRRTAISVNQQEIARATDGVVMITLAIYLALNAGYLFGPGYWPISGTFMWIAAGAWGLLLLGGTIAFLVGVRRSHGERDIIGTAWTVAFAVAGAGLLVWGAYVPQRLVPAAYDEINFLLKGAYLWVLVKSAGILLLSMRGARSGLDEVAAQKAHGDISLASENDARAAKLLDQNPAHAIRLGSHGFNGEGAVLAYAGERHLLLLGPNGSGKATRVLMPDLLSIQGRSVVVIDPKGELAAVTADYRRTVSDVVMLNPFDTLGLGSAGFNPLATLDPTAASFVDDAAGLGEALIKIEGKDPHWPESAQALMVALLMWEVTTARKAGRVPSLENVRALLTEAEEWEETIGADGKPRRKPVTGLRVTAAKMIAHGGFEIESLAGRFLRDRDEIANIQSTADTQTRWLLSPAVRGDLAKHGIDFADLKKKPTTVYVVLPAERMRTHSVWLRLVIVSALRSLYHPGGLPVLFMLDEFAQLGHLAPIEDAFGLVRGYGVQLWPILQDLNQLRELYKQRAETFIANAGIVQCFAPNDLTTAEWMSRRAGETTIVASGFNQNVGGSPNANEGMSYQQAKRPLFLPQELIDLPAGAGLLWQAGIAKAFPFFGHPVWEIPEYWKLAKRNPYYQAKS